jgi:hypothetical protein
MWVRSRLWLPLGGYPLQKSEEIRPFFIIGSGRSGNTLLRRILYAHPSLHIPPETYVLGRTIRLFQRYCRLPWRDLVFLILAQFQFHEQFFTFNMELGTLALKLLDIPQKDRSLAKILNAFYCHHAAEQDAVWERWGDKTPLNVFHLDPIFMVFPQAQFIHLIRDGCDVVASYLRHNLYQDEKTAAERWLSAIDAATQVGNRHPDIYLELRYESFVSQPAESVKTICNFLGIEYLPEMLMLGDHIRELGDVSYLEHHYQVGQPISSDHVGNGRQYLTKSQKQTICHIMNPTLTQLGYEPL